MFADFCTNQDRRRRTHHCCDSLHPRRSEQEVSEEHIDKLTLPRQQMRSQVRRTSFLAVEPFGSGDVRVRLSRAESLILDLSLGVEVAVPGVFADLPVEAPDLLGDKKRKRIGQSAATSEWG